MTLVSSERLYSGKIINLDRDTVQFPNRIDRPPGDDSSPRGLGGGSFHG